MKSRIGAAVSFVVVAACLTGCQANPNEIAMQVGAPPAGAVELRSMQSKRFDSTNSVAIMNAATQTLQDLGFTIQESASAVGVLSASKQRDAEEAGQIAGAVALTFVGALFGAYVEPTWDKDQTINVTVVEFPVAGNQQVDLRVSFDRNVRNNRNVQRAEIIMEPKIYQEFFEKFSKSLMLEKAQ